MDAKLLKSISVQIYRRFPEISGSQPKVSLQSTPNAKSAPKDVTYLITYRGQATSPTGKNIPRIIRVIANSQGQIVKVSTSR